MALRNKIRKPETKSDRNHQLAIIEDREQEPVRNLLPIPTQAVAHVLVSEVRPTDREKPKATKKIAKRDRIGEEITHLFVSELTETSECLAEQRECGSRNVLHSTATESGLAKPGTEHRYVGNILGVGADVHIITGSLASHRIKEPKVLKERGIANEHRLPTATYLAGKEVESAAGPAPPTCADRRLPSRRIRE